MTDCQQECHPDLVLINDIHNVDLNEKMLHLSETEADLSLQWVV
jgi:hypothetical protein